MKFVQYLTIILSLIILPQVTFGETRGHSSYSDKEVSQISRILMIKKACDLHVPEYYLNNMMAYANWRGRHGSVILEIEDDPAYINELEDFRNKLGLMTAQQISETLMECEKVTDRLNANGRG